MVEAYPLISRVCRDEAQHKKSTHVHHCHGSMVAAGLGYDDLNKLFKEPQDLEFIFELIKVEQPDEYEKEPWQMDTEQKLKLIPKLKEKGNILYQNKKYEKAIEKYDLALTFIDQLQLREKPRDTEWNHLNSMKLPFHLNIAQCKLCLNDFYAAIEHCNSVLQNDRDNIKALFRRGKAHMNVWNIQEAREDLKRVLQLDATQKSVVLPLLNNLKEIERKGKDVEKAMMAKSLF